MSNMPFKDTDEGKTHFHNDGCGDPAHNDITDTLKWADDLPDSEMYSHVVGVEYLEKEWLSGLVKLMNKCPKFTHNS